MFVPIVQVYRTPETVNWLTTTAATIIGMLLIFWRRRSR